MKSVNHVELEALERYSLERSGEAEAALLEEHLLICSECREGLERLDAYHRAIFGALRQIDPTRIGTVAIVGSVVF